MKSPIGLARKISKMLPVTHSPSQGLYCISTHDGLIAVTSATRILCNNTRVGAGITGPKPSKGHCLNRRTGIECLSPAVRASRTISKPPRRWLIIGMHWLQLTITLQVYTTREKVCANHITASSFHVHASCFNDFAHITVQNLRFCVGRSREADQRSCSKKDGSPSKKKKRRGDAQIAATSE